MADQKDSALGTLTALTIATADRGGRMTDVSDTSASAAGTNKTATMGEERQWHRSGGVHTFSDADVTAVAGDLVLYQDATLTATRTVTLPAAAAVPAGYMLTVVDGSTTATPANRIVVSRAGSDKINAVSNTTVLASAFCSVTLISDGVSNWTVVGTALQRMWIGPWIQDNVTGTQSNVDLQLGATVTNAVHTKMAAIRDGMILGVSVASSEARTAGTCTVEPTVNGTGCGLTAVLNVTNTQYKATGQATSAIDTFVANDALGIRVTTASWTPTTADITVYLEIGYHGLGA